MFIRQCCVRRKQPWSLNISCFCLHTRRLYTQNYFVALIPVLEGYYDSSFLIPEDASPECCHGVLSGNSHFLWVVSSSWQGWTKATISGPEANIYSFIQQIFIELQECKALHEVIYATWRPGKQSESSRKAPDVDKVNGKNLWKNEIGFILYASCYLFGNRWIKWFGALRS